jgi:hypothetical protein
MAKSRMVFEKFLRVVSVDEAGARKFAHDFFGIPADKVVMIVDGGPAVRPEKYKPEAREFHVYVKSA